MRKSALPKLFLKISALIFLISALILFVFPASAYNAKRVSLNKYTALSLPVPNPVDITRLPKDKSYEIKHEHFILQFFFSYHQDIKGIIVKRDMKRSIHLRWCFYRDCEENPLDYVSIIAQPNQPPFGDQFFWLKFPPQIKYSFQGLKFFTGK